MTADAVLTREESQPSGDEKNARSELETKAKEGLKSLAELTGLNDLRNTPTSSKHYKYSQAADLINKIKGDAMYLLENERYKQLSNGALDLIINRDFSEKSGSDYDTPHVISEIRELYEVAQNSIPAADVTVTVDGTLYYVDFRADVDVAAALNASDGALPKEYIERIMDIQGNTLNLDDDTINNLITIIRQNTGNSGGELCFASDGSAQPTAVCDGDG
ncbi:MAG: hypothetical protein C0582_01070 [Alphaproteobacteria bacterium]|nr:MAG: hypothetical protein C0582_01070 [Alphaproteobacteria bacterium]